MTGILKTNKKIAKLAIKKIFNVMGFDIQRLNKTPKYSLLGLRNLQIRTIIDIGANTGQFASNITQIFPQAHIYCFEPLPNAFKELGRWQKSKKDKVNAINLALGDSEGEIEMFYHYKHSSSSSILKTKQITESLYPFTKKQQIVKIQQTTLDKAVNDFNIPLTPEIIIKLDVQGYEDRVIRGGEKTFKYAKACILEINLDELYETQPSFKDISLLLYDLGYHYAGNLNQTFAKDGHVISIDAVFEEE